MWLVGSSCLCKLMTSLFFVVSFHWFVLLAHWSPHTPLLNPSSSSPGPAPSLLINTRADGIHSAEEKKSAFFINRWLRNKNSIYESGSTWLDKVKSCHQVWCRFVLFCEQKKYCSNYLIPFISFTRHVNQTHNWLWNKDLYRSNIMQETLNIFHVLRGSKIWSSKLK